MASIEADALTEGQLAVVEAERIFDEASRPPTFVQRLHSFFAWLGNLEYKTEILIGGIIGAAGGLGVAVGVELVTSSVGLPYKPFLLEGVLIGGAVTGGILMYLDAKDESNYQALH